MNQLKWLLGEIDKACEEWTECDGVPPAWGHFSLGISKLIKHRLEDPSFLMPESARWTAVGCGTIVFGLLALSKILPTHQDRKVALSFHSRLHAEITALVLAEVDK